MSFWKWFCGDSCEMQPNPAPEVWTEIARWKFIYSTSGKIGYIPTDGSYGQYGVIKTEPIEVKAVMIIKQSSKTGKRIAEAVFINGRVDVPIEYAEMLQKEPPAFPKEELK